MKYVRTEDGAILEKDHVLHNISRAYGVKDIKQAKTIEELCDEFVYEYNDELPLIRYRETGKPTLSVLYENMKHSNHITNIYGAIWTAKGLIYVAKINGKGELELL